MQVHIVKQVANRNISSRDILNKILKVKEFPQENLVTKERIILEEVSKKKNINDKEGCRHAHGPLKVHVA